MRFRLLVASAAVLLAASLPAGAAFTPRANDGPGENVLPLAVIVNRSNPVGGVSLGELRAMFLGRRSTWDHGRRVTIALREPGEPEREAALRLIYRMTEPELTRYLLQQTFTGAAAVPPRTLSTASGVRRFVVNVPGAIGLVAAADVDATVKVLRVDGRAIGEAGYPLVFAER